MRELFNYRYYVLIAVVTVALVATFSGCDNDDMQSWIAYHVATKFLGLSMWALAYRLIEYWNVRGKIKGLTNLTKYVDD